MDAGSHLMGQVLEALKGLAVKGLPAPAWQFLSWGSRRVASCMTCRNAVITAPKARPRDRIDPLAGALRALNPAAV